MRLGQYRGLWVGCPNDQQCPKGYPSPISLSSSGSDSPRSMYPVLGMETSKTLDGPRDSMAWMPTKSQGPRGRSPYLSFQVHRLNGGYYMPPCCFPQFRTDTLFCQVSLSALYVYKYMSVNVFTLQIARLRRSLTGILGFL